VRDVWQEEKRRRLAEELQKTQLSLEIERASRDRSQGALAEAKRTLDQERYHRRGEGPQGQAWGGGWSGGERLVAQHHPTTLPYMTGPLSVDALGESRRQGHGSAAEVEALFTPGATSQGNANGMTPLELAQSQRKALQEQLSRAAAAISRGGGVSKQLQ
jgi:hypothetical protein